MWNSHYWNIVFFDSLRLMNILTFAHVRLCFRRYFFIITKFWGSCKKTTQGLFNLKAHHPKALWLRPARTCPSCLRKETNLLRALLVANTAKTKVSEVLGTKERCMWADRYGGNSKVAKHLGPKFSSIMTEGRRHER